MEGAELWSIVPVQPTSQHRQDVTVQNLVQSDLATGWAGWVRTVAGMDQTLALNLSDLSQAATISNKISLVTGLGK